MIEVVLGPVSCCGIRYKARYKSKVSYIFLRSIITIILTFTYSGCILYKVQIIFPQILFHYQHNIFTYA
jgi:hypothetical protein